MTIETKMYVCSDALQNNNKFWTYTYDDATGMCTVKYGRVGKTSNVEGPKPMSRAELDRKIREKVNGRGKPGTASYKPPYREIEVVTEVVTKSPAKTSSAEVKQAAIEQLAKNDTALTSLVERLVQANKHELHRASGGQLNLDLSTGIVSTPIGVVTKANVLQARDLLDSLAVHVGRSAFDDPAFVKDLNSYLMLVPQTVGHAKGWHRSFLPSDSALQRQNSLLDQLEASADLAADRLAAAQKSGTSVSISQTPSLFDATLKVCDDAKVFTMIERLFLESINDRHESRHLRPIKVYEVELPSMKGAWDADGAKLSDHRLLWHGTRVFNVLSILKSGLMLPKAIKSMHITGAMFGNGVYFSSQSTKSLNYAYGYWDGGKRDDNCFMFLADVAMGKHYVPRSSYETLPKSGYDSTWAIPGKSGIMNDEMIVYRTSQCNLRYLVEFDRKR